MSQYKECEKMKSVEPESLAIASFLDWCTESGYELRDWSSVYHDQPQSLSISTEQLLADYFQIDLKKVEQERQQMLTEFSESNV